MNRCSDYSSLRRLGWLLPAFVLFAALSLHAGKQPDLNTLSKVEDELKQATNATDSIRLLYNIFDILSDDIGITDSLLERRINALEKLRTTAQRAGNTGVMLDAIRNMSNLYKADKSNQSRLMDITRNLPASDEQKETMAFIRLTRNTWGASALIDRPIEERTENLRLALQDHQQSIDDGVSDTYDQFENLMNLVVYGSSMLQPEQISSYLNELDSLILLTRSSDASLANLYYTQAAQLYSQIGKYENAVESDKHLLDIIKQLEEKATNMGREYKDYSMF
ncbi:MAG: hypothetical protein K2K84_08460, partial [Muribaculaceae bacterium]|nr:hypothetical protein [Muribaculaceae bacterium]